MIVEAARNQHVDLALGKLVQPGGFDDPRPDRRVRRAKTVRTQAAELETGIDAGRQHGGDPWGLSRSVAFAMR